VYDTVGGLFHLDDRGRRSVRVLQCVAVCCSVLQCVAVCCSVLQYVAVCCSMLQCVAVCSVQYVAERCRALQNAAVCCSLSHLNDCGRRLAHVLQCVEVSSVLKNVAVC